MTLEITRILASKFNGEQGSVSTVLDIAASSNGTITFTIPRGYVFYFLSYTGNVTTSDVSLSIRNRTGQDIVTHTEFPDMPVTVEYYNFIKESFKDSLSIYVVNGTSVTSTLTFMLDGILLPSNNTTDFEKEVLAFASLPSLIPKILGGREATRDEILYGKNINCP